MISPYLNSVYRYSKSCKASFIQLLRVLVNRFKEYFVNCLLKSPLIPLSNAISQSAVKLNALIKLSPFRSNQHLLLLYNLVQPIK